MYGEFKYFSQLVKNYSNIHIPSTITPSKSARTGKTLIEYESATSNLGMSRNPMPYHLATAHWIHFTIKDFFLSENTKFFYNYGTGFKIKKYFSN